MEADLRPSELGVAEEGAFQGAEVDKKTQRTSELWVLPPYHLIGRLCEQGHCSGLLYGDLRVKKDQIFRNKKIFKHYIHFNKVRLYFSQIMKPMLSIYVCMLNIDI